MTFEQLFKICVAVVTWCLWKLSAGPRVDPVEMTSAIRFSKLGLITLLLMPADTQSDITVRVMRCIFQEGIGVNER